MLRFECIIDVESEKWDNEDQKKVFMENCEKVVQQGLGLATVPDWTVTVKNVKEIKEE